MGAFLENPKIFFLYATKTVSIDHSPLFQHVQILITSWPEPTIYSLVVVRCLFICPVGRQRLARRERATLGEGRAKKVSVFCWGMRPSWFPGEGRGTIRRSTERCTRKKFFNGIVCYPFRRASDTLRSSATFCSNRPLGVQPCCIRVCSLSEL